MILLHGRKRTLIWLDRMLSSVLIMLMALLVLSIVWQVLSRYIINVPSSVTEELARFSLIWTSLLGASYAYRQRMHLGLNVITEKLTGNTKHYAGFAVLCVVVVFAVSIMVVGGGRLVLLTLELSQKTAVMGLPMALIYSVIPLSGVLIVLYSLDMAVDMRAEKDGFDKNNKTKKELEHE